MAKFIMKTYNDSYLYKIKLGKQNDSSDPAKRNNQAILDFIIKAHRVEDKKSDQFRGIVEEVKRQQTSSVLYNVLMMDNVKICINQYELPRAFKVFDAKDPNNNRQPAIFIDASGIIELKNGYYVCKKIDVLCAYLFDALIYLLYRYYPNKLVDNTSIITSALECYVAMFHNNIEYMGVPGYSMNRKKIGYLAGLFFLTNMMGKDLDNYTKSLAGKLLNLTGPEINAYNLYLNSVDFTDINTFITTISETFKLKGLTLEVFVSKWMYYYGTGTHYATELLTSFLSLIVNAYSGCYIVGQRQVERSCSTAMVKLSTSIIKAGVDAYGSVRAYMNESDAREREVHDKNSRELAEAKILESKIDFRKLVVTESDFSSIDYVKEKIKDIKEICKFSKTDHRLNEAAYKSIQNGIKAIYENSINILSGKDSSYEDGALVECAKLFKESFSNKENYSLNSTIDRDIENLMEFCQESEASTDIKKSVAKSILEYRNLKQYI